MRKRRIVPFRCLIAVLALMFVLSWATRGEAGMNSQSMSVREFFARCLSGGLEPGHVAEVAGRVDPSNIYQDEDRFFLLDRDDGSVILEVRVAGDGGQIFEKARQYARNGISAVVKGEVGSFAMPMNNSASTGYYLILDSSPEFGKSLNP